jgi:hypothetical protein
MESRERLCKTMLTLMSRNAFRGKKITDYEDNELKATLIARQRSINEGQQCRALRTQFRPAAEEISADLKVSYKSNPRTY